MKTEHRNLLIDLIPKLFERPNFENLIKRLGQPDVLDEVPGNASFKEAATFVVDRAIQAGWAPALVAATREEFPVRKELDGLDVLPPAIATPPPAPDAKWWRKPAVLPAIAAVVGVAITLLVIKMWPSSSSTPTHDDAASAPVADAAPIDARPPRPLPPRPLPPRPPTDAAVADAPPDARMFVPPINLVIAKLREGLTFPIGKCQNALWQGPRRVASRSVVDAACKCSGGSKTPYSQIAIYNDISELPARDVVRHRLENIGTRCP